MKNLTDQDYLAFIVSSDKDSTIKLLYEVLGAQALTDLMRHFGGDNLYIPKIDEVYRIKRDQDIRKDFAKGFTIAQLARTYNLSARTIYKVLKQTVKIYNCEEIM